MIFEESNVELERRTRKLIETSIMMGLQINENETKYMLMSRHPAFRSLNVGRFSFKQVENL